MLACYLRYNVQMTEFKDLIAQILSFCQERDWKQFHNPKDLAISLNLEASELLELFQWKSKEEVAEYVKTNKKEIGEELADVLYWVLLMSHDLNIDLLEAFNSKMQKNAKNYPVGKSRGRAVKHTKLHELDELVEMVAKEDKPVDKEKVLNVPKDRMFEVAVKLMHEKKKISASLIQNAFNIGYVRAAQILDRLEAEGYIGPDVGYEPREILK
jgi:NTP pyrophosphatase (non-canonical NTP hydrolase)